MSPIAESQGWSGMGVDERRDIIAMKDPSKNRLEAVEVEKREYHIGSGDLRTFGSPDCFSDMVGRSLFRFPSINHGAVFIIDT